MAMFESSGDDRAALAFQYAPLRSQLSTIRLLHIYPGQGLTPIAGDLTQHSIESPPDYEAISYRWGEEADDSNPSKEPHIQIGNAFLKITPSLRSALAIFRNHHTTRTLWIDQICINQKDNVEKSKQVPLMGKIYSRATQTLIWLGSGDDSIMAAVALIKSFDTFRQEIEGLVVENGTRPGVAWAVTVMGMLKKPVDELVRAGVPSAATLPEIGDIEVEQILSIFSLPWFTRTWIIQEVVLSRKKIAQIGDTQLAWEDIGFFVTWFMHRFNNLDIPESSTKGLRSMNYINWYSKIYNSGFCMASMLRMVRLYEVFDPRDKVFALLGLINFNLDPDGRLYDTDLPNTHDMELPLPLRPDYTKSVLDVYFGLARYQIERDQSINFLTFVDHPPDVTTRVDWLRERSPSWIPGWNELQDPTEPLWFPEAPGTNFRASSVKTTDITISQDRDETGAFRATCTVRGYKIDEVKASHALATTKNWKSLESNDWSLVIDWINSEVKHCMAVQDVVPKAVVEDIATAVILGRGVATQGAFELIPAGNTEVLQRNVENFTNFLFNVHIPEHSNYDPLRTLKSHLEETTTISPLSYNVDSAKAFAKRVHSACLNRTMYRTDTGRIGLGPSGIAPGDEICVLETGLVPFVLRASDAGDFSANISRLVVGTCYLRGAMEGEFDEHVSREGVQFVLS